MPQVRTYDFDIAMVLKGFCQNRDGTQYGTRNVRNKEGYFHTRLDIDA